LRISIDTVSLHSLSVSLSCSPKRIGSQTNTTVLPRGSEQDVERGTADVADSLPKTLLPQLIGRSGSIWHTSVRATALLFFILAKSKCAVRLDGPTIFGSIASARNIDQQAPWKSGHLRRGCGSGRNALVLAHSDAIIMCIGKDRARLQELGGSHANDGDRIGSRLYRPSSRPIGDCSRNTCLVELSVSSSSKSGSFLRCGARWRLAASMHWENRQPGVPRLLQMFRQSNQHPELFLQLEHVHPRPHGHTKPGVVGL